MPLKVSVRGRGDGEEFLSQKLMKPAAGWLVGGCLTADANQSKTKKEQRLNRTKEDKTYKDSGQGLWQNK